MVLSFVVGVGLDRRGTWLPGPFRRHAAHREPHQLRRAVHDHLAGHCAAVSLFTPAVPFQIKPPTPESAIDREYDRELAQEELESATASAAADA